MDAHLIISLSKQYKQNVRWTVLDGRQTSDSQNMMMIVKSKKYMVRNG